MARKEDDLVLNPEARKSIERSREEIAQGESVTLAELKKRMKR